MAPVPKRYRRKVFSQACDIEAQEENVAPPPAQSFVPKQYRKTPFLKPRDIEEQEDSIALLPLQSTRSVGPVHGRKLATPTTHSDSLPNRYQSHKPTERQNNGPEQSLDSFSGWRGGVALNTLFVTVVLLLNVVFLIWASTRYGTNGGIGRLYWGDCDTVKLLTLFAHLVINILSTLMLAASNYTMQVLAAPTREEVQKAHEKEESVQIGVQSIRNLRHVSTKRVLLWVVLGISSIPLHLLYNSAIFSSTGANRYLVATVSPSFFTSNMVINTTQKPYFLTSYYGLENTVTQNSSQLGISDKELLAINQMNSSNSRENWTRMSARSCVDAYSKSFQTSYRNLFVVINAPEYENDLLARVSSPQDIYPFSWICNDTKVWFPTGCNSENLQEYAADWSIDGRSVKECVAESTVEHCELNFHRLLLITVIVANAAKLFAMLVLLNFFNELTLVTLGDAIASFIDHPDTTTRGMCLADYKAFQASHRKRRSDQIFHWVRESKEYLPDEHPVRWFTMVSTGQWLKTLGMMISVLLATIVLCIAATQHLRRVNPDQDTSLQGLFSMGFGALRTSSTITNISSNMEVLVIVANTPQLALSFAYVLINRILSGMASSREWTSFAHTRTGLRVTRAVGEQKSTYYLQLPYMFAVPQIVTSISVHYIISQSVFPSRIKIYDYIGQAQVFEEYRALGFSSIAIIAGIGLWVFIIVALLALGLVKNKRGIPQAGLSSAAISAACHPPLRDRNISLKQVMWGQTSMNERTGRGHCSFSSTEVTAPIEGTMYQ